MYRRREAIAEPVILWFEDLKITAAPGDSLAAALLAAGVSVFRRTPVSGAKRGPFCMIGNCFECLVEIDGQGVAQACSTEVRQGMRVYMPRGQSPGEGD
jgi:predicted molibdopterin-dependent oxidoreductase YjgC